MNECNYLIIGAGITGLTIARELLLRGQTNIVVIEKESSAGVHASGRNSGVLHAGIYYTPDSLKAKFCVEGNTLLTRYCEENRLNLNKCGKAIVAKGENEIVSLHKLQDRAVKNGVRSRFITEKELKEIEPYAYTHKEAIFSPDTAVFDPVEIITSIYNELEGSGEVRFLFNTGFIEPLGNSTLSTTSGEIKYERLVNASGAFSDRIAQSFGIAGNYRILPFLGTYARITGDKTYLVNGNVYPVPDDRTPFLGVHFTRGHNGTVYIGPTAIPAIGRESYDYLSNYSPETFSILYRDCVMFFMNSAFRDNALSEVKKYFGSYMFKEARKMIPSLEKEDVLSSSKVGIRPQLVDWEKKEMVMDFKVLSTENSVHILNAISPAFSSSMAFAKFIADEYLDG